MMERSLTVGYGRLTGWRNYNPLGWSYRSRKKNTMRKRSNELLKELDQTTGPPKARDIVDWRKVKPIAKLISATVIIKTDSNFIGNICWVDCLLLRDEKCKITQKMPVNYDCSMKEKLVLCLFLYLEDISREIYSFLADLHFLPLICSMPVLVMLQQCPSRRLHLLVKRR